MAEFAITTKETIPEASIDMTTKTSTAATLPADTTTTKTSGSKINLDDALNFQAPQTSSTIGQGMTLNSSGTGLTMETPEEAVQDVSADINVASTDELEANQTEMTVPSATEPTGDLSYTPTVSSDEKILAEIADKQGQIQELEQKKAFAEQREAVEDQRNDVFEAFTELGDMEGFISQVEDETKLNQRREELTEITNKINRKSLEFRRQIEGIQDLPGLTRAQKNARIADVDRRNSREIADLEIIAMARQGRFNDAQAIVDRKVEIEMMTRSNQLEGLKFLYSENKDRFTTLEQRQFEKTIKEEERAYQKEYDKTSELESLKLQMTINATEAGASIGELEAIQNAKDTTQLFSTPNAGRYMKTKAQILDEQLKGMQLTKASIDIANARAIANGETSSGGISPVTGKPYTIDQQNSGLFANRMEDAEKTLEDGKGFYGAQDGWINTPQAFRSEDRRMFEQAENNFITATLRKESGASIAPEEYETARKIYIPLWSDSEKVLEKKAQARERARLSFQTGSAGFYDEVRSMSPSEEPTITEEELAARVIQQVSKTGNLYSTSGLNVN